MGEVVGQVAEAPHLGAVRLDDAADLPAAEHVLPLARLAHPEEGLGGIGLFTKSILRLLALQGTRRWGRCAMVGEGNRVDFDVSQTIIHNQISIYGSWVTSLGHMEDLVEKLVEWNLKPEVIVSHRFPLAQAAEAYRVADEGQSGKVCIVFD